MRKIRKQLLGTLLHTDDRILGALCGKKSHAIVTGRKFNLISDIAGQ